MRVRTWHLAVAALVLGAGVPALTAQAAPAPARAPTAGGCPVLVLSALPVELDPILAHARVDSTPAYVANGRGFWSGTVEGNRAVFALTGIGLVNATRTTEAAFAHFGCFSAVVFSGTSGGDFIGDVMVPARWTQDGRHFLPTSARTLAVFAQARARVGPLEQTVPVGDPLCRCAATGAAGVSTAVKVEHQPVVEVGGTGLSTDGFGGRAFPCIPAASDVFGCWPCLLANGQIVGQTLNLATSVPPFLQPSFLLDYASNSVTPPGRYVSEDNETAAVFAVAAQHRVPFIGFRAASDGGGDPLHLPGFPAEFFVYRQLAADNAAAATLAFLAAWRAA